MKFLHEMNEQELRAEVERLRALLESQSVDHDRARRDAREARAEASNLHRTVEELTGRLRELESRTPCDEPD